MEIIEMLQNVTIAFMLCIVLNNLIRTGIRIEIRHPNPEPMELDEEVQKALDEEYEKEQAAFADSVKKVQSLFVESEDEANERG